MLKRAMNFGRLVAFSLVLAAAGFNAATQAAVGANSIAQATSEASNVAIAVAALAELAPEA